MTGVGSEVLGMFSVKEVAAMLRLSEVTIRRRIKSGALEAVHDGSRVLIAPEAVTKYKAQLPSAAQSTRTAA